MNQKSNIAQTLFNQAVIEYSFTSLVDFEVVTNEDKISITYAKALLKGDFAHTTETMTVTSETEVEEVEKFIDETFEYARNIQRDLLDSCVYSHEESLYQSY